MEVTRKYFNNNIAMFDIRRFGETLDFNFPESDPSKWGIKKEWRELAKKYFSSARPTELYVKGVYDFFHRNKDKITSSGQKHKRRERN